MQDLMGLRIGTPPPGRNYTPTGDVLDTHLLEYRRQTGNRPGRPGVKKRIFIVITDGAACKSLWQPVRVLVGIDHLDLFFFCYQTADAPEDVIASSATFFQKNHFPLDQVLDLSHIPVLESDQLNHIVHRRSGYSLSRLVTTRRRRSSWKN